MFNRFSKVLQNAVDALAPPVPMLDDFTYHWKMLMKFYMNQNTLAKTSIESTNIPGHLDQLLKLLLEEEKELEVGTTGPCLEYLLQHHLLDLLATLACTDCPPGMKQHTLGFVRRLITQTKQPILPHIGIYKGIQRLIASCNGMNASPTEKEEIHFLCTLCALICNDPHLMNIFNSLPSNNGSQPVSQKDSCSEQHNIDQKQEMSEKSESEQANQTDSKTEVPKSEGFDAIEERLLPESSDNGAAQKFKEEVGTSEKLKTEPVLMSSGRKFPLLDALLSFLMSADRRVMVKACEGLMVIASLPSDDLAKLVSQQSDLCVVLSSRLQSTFNTIPGDVDPNDLDELTVKWGLDGPLWSDESMFYGCREVASFLAWLDFCDQLTREAHPILGTAIAENVQELFLNGVLGTSLRRHADELLDETEPTIAKPSQVLVTAFITKCLKQTTAPALVHGFVCWLVGEESSQEISTESQNSIFPLLIENCFDERDEIALETLRLFEVILEKPHESVLQNLVLQHLIGRGYYDTHSIDLIASWSDEEDERVKNREDSADLDFSPGSSPVSRTLAPSNIHKIINSFLLLVPQHLKSTSSPEQSGYQQYVADADRAYRECIAGRGQNSWPSEATSPEPVLAEDEGSNDSRPEADHQFFEGPFLHMLFARLLRLPFQPYEINLQLTGLLSRLAVQPHPYLHEFLLNPLLPIIDGTITLFVTLQAVVEQLAEEIPAVENHESLAEATRIKLLGDDNSLQLESNSLFESLIVLEEFCKELAAIAFVKYHHSS